MCHANTTNQNQFSKTKTLTEQSPNVSSGRRRFFNSQLRLQIRRWQNQSGESWLNSRKTARVCGECLSHTCRIALIWLLAFSPIASAEVGIASYYGTNPQKEHLNKHTASGQVFYPTQLTAASYQFYKKYVRVRSIETGREITVWVNDLGPNKRLNRLIDLTPSAYQLLGLSLKSGLAQVDVTEVLS